jgi:hypothetical protein
MTPHWVMGGLIGSRSPVIENMWRNMVLRLRFVDSTVNCVQGLTMTQPVICDSNLRAVDHANSKFSKGYVSTGVGGVLCARHCYVRKNGLGNLQKGER